MIEWPKPLVEDLAAKKVAVYLGGGVSKNASGNGGARPPLWAELLKSAKEECGNAGTRHIAAALKDNDLLHACEWLQKRWTRDGFPSCVSS